MVKLTLLLAALISINEAAKDLKLKTVLSLSRHNIRTPLTENLKELTQKEWVKWETGPSLLTDKGFLLEGYMAKFFYQWLKKEGIITEDCPDDNEVYIYANTRPRTKDTAIAFARAFNNCNTSVHYLNTEEMDPVFNPVIHNASEEFKKIVVAEMEEKIEQLDLTKAFNELNEIIGLKDSEICKKDGYCDFAKFNNTVWYEVGEELNIEGPLQVGNAIVDSFIMSYYDGKPENEVAWGRITTPKQWELLTRISKENQNVRFNLTTTSKDVAGPLLKYMSNILLDDNSTRKFTLLVGHDSNLNPVMSALKFKPYYLPNQYEPFPIGGKLVFEKWSDGATDYAKIEYIYQTWQQLRNGARIDLDKPPQKAVLELQDCKTDENGFCLWSDFVKVLNDVI